MAVVFRRARRALPAAILWSLAGHLVLFGWARWKAPVPTPSAPETVARQVEFTAEIGVPSRPVGTLAQGALLPPQEPGPRAATIPGPADAWNPEMASPWPSADVDTPDARAAARGGGATGGTPSWTGRNDGDEELHAQAWNDPDTYRLERHANSTRRRSPESIAREVAPDIDNAHRDRRRAALDGQRAPMPQPDPGDPNVSADRPHADAETLTDAPRPGSPAPPADTRPSEAAQDGAIVTHAGRPDLKEGAEATEATVRGERADNADAAQASNETHPIPLELTRPSAGGHGGVGVAGPSPGAGNSARSPRTGSGQGGSPADLPERPGGKAATVARAQEAFFRKLKKRVHEKLVYPPDLAAALEQGEVVVAFTLRSDGSIADVRISRPSGYEEFDAAALRAVRQAAPFGPVPESVRGGRDTLRTSVPITFANPLIR